MKNQKDSNSTGASTKNKLILVSVLILCAVAFKYFGKGNQDSPVSASHEEKILGLGSINTIVDDTDVREVNLWTSTKPDRKIACSVVMGQKLRVIRGSGEYYYVEAVGRTGCEGYCMMGFVQLD